MNPNNMNNFKRIQVEDEMKIICSNPNIEGGAWYFWSAEEIQARMKLVNDFKASGFSNKAAWYQAFQLLPKKKVPNDLIPQ